MARRILIAPFALAALAAVLPMPVGRQVYRATEMAAVRDIVILTSVQTQYRSQFGKYGGSLAEIGPAENSVHAGPWAAGLIPASLASGRKDGYSFKIARTPGGYSIHAEPIIFGKTGHRTFYADQSMMIHQNWGQEPASADSPEFK